MLVTVSDFPGVLRVGDLDVAVSVSDRRKSVRLTVERDASVTAVVPPQVSRAELTKLVEAKRSWLYGKLAEKRISARPRRTGSSSPVRGSSIWDAPTGCASSTPARCAWSAGGWSWPGVAARRSWSTGIAGSAHDG